MVSNDITDGLGPAQLGQQAGSRSHPRFANAHQLNVSLMDLANETGWKKRNQIDSHARSDEVGGRSI